MVPCGGQAGHHQGGAGPEVGGHHRGARSVTAAPDDGVASRDADVRAQAAQFADVHEAVFEDGFGDHRGAPSHAHQGHELRLHVGGEAGVGEGADIHPGEGAAGMHADAARFGAEAHSRLV